MTDQPGYDAALSLETLQAVVELQRTELSRLLREQTRLNERIDALLRLHEREQVLRQQMQVSLDRLAAARLAAPDRAGAVRNAPPDFVAPEVTAPEVTALRTRIERTESRFSALQDAVGSLVNHIERHMPDATGTPDGAGFVRIYAPG